MRMNKPYRQSNKALPTRGNLWYTYTQINPSPVRLRSTALLTRGTVMEKRTRRNTFEISIWKPQGEITLRSANVR